MLDDAGGVYWGLLDMAGLLLQWCSRLGGGKRRWKLWIYKS